MASLGDTELASSGARSRIVASSAMPQEPPSEDSANPGTAALAPQSSGKRQLQLLGLIAIAWLIALECLVWARLTPPAVVPADAPLETFSAARAAQVLERLLGNGEPHPAGSPAQGQVRARLLGELRSLGLEPEVQVGVACAADGTCAELHNVLAMVSGLEPTLELGLMAHYDSVPAGPGAGDDGQGVASSIEIARSLVAARPRVGVALVLTDGEELGMLGAQLFVDKHPLAPRLRTVLNLEARGSRGPSLMFETTPNNARLIEAFSSAPRPVSSSLFATVYRTLPNDTDLSVLARHGIQGLNFAFVGGVEHYHTSKDSLATLDLRSVQAQGAAALATLRELTEQKSEAPRGEAVFFDLLAGVLVHVPAALMLPLAFVAALAFGVSLRRALRQSTGYARGLGRGVAALLAAWVLPALVAGLIGWVLEALGALPFPIIATPEPLVLSLVLLCCGGGALALRVMRSSKQPLALWDATWSCWLVIGLLLSVALPAAAYVAVFPALIAALARLSMQADRCTPRDSLLMLASASAAAVLWLPLLSLLPAVLGFSSPALLALAVGMGLSPFIPLLAALLEGRRVYVGLLAGGVGVGLSQLAWPPYSDAVPQRVSLVLEVDPQGQAHWLAEGWSGPLPESLHEAGDFAPRATHPHPWPGHAQHLMYRASAGAPASPHVPSRLDLIGPSSLRLQLLVPEEIWALGVKLPPEAKVTQARWRGERFKPAAGSAGWHFLMVPAQDRSLSVELDFGSAAPSQLEVVEIRRGLPEDGQRLMAARGEAAVASHFGDLTVTRVKVDAQRHDPESAP